mgnify:CR=1 FL=1
MNGRIFQFVFLLSLLTLIICGCKQKQTINPHVELEITPVRTQYLLGESAYFSFSLTNNSEQPVSIYNFAQVSWPYELPEQVRLHLIAPSGEDLYADEYIDYAEPYDKSIFTMMPLEEINLRTRIAILTLAPQLHLHELGRYHFWVETEDLEGNLIRSNDVLFDMVEPKFSVPPEDVSITISANSPYKADESWPVEVIFSNLSNKTLTFLEPQDGSSSGWRYPIYRFSAFDESGYKLQLPVRDALQPAIYNEDTQFMLRPGESHSLTLLIPRFIGMKTPGQYKIQLLYAVRELEMFHFSDYWWEIEKANQLESMNWDEDVFLGHIFSNEIAITIEE